MAFCKTSSSATATSPRPRWSSSVVSACASSFLLSPPLSCLHPPPSSVFSCLLHISSLVPPSSFFFSFVFSQMSRVSPSSIVPTTLSLRSSYPLLSHLSHVPLSLTPISRSILHTLSSLAVLDYLPPPLFPFSRSTLHTSFSLTCFLHVLPLILLSLSSVYLLLSHLSRTSHLFLRSLTLFYLPPLTPLMYLSPLSPLSRSLLFTFFSHTSHVPLPSFSTLSLSSTYLNFSLTVSCTYLLLYPPLVPLSRSLCIPISSFS